MVFPALSTACIKICLFSSYSSTLKFLWKSLKRPPFQFSVVNLAGVRINRCKLVLETKRSHTSTFFADGWETACKPRFFVSDFKLTYLKVAPAKLTIWSCESCWKGAWPATRSTCEMINRALVCERCWETVSTNLAAFHLKSLPHRFTRF